MYQSLKQSTENVLPVFSGARFFCSTTTVFWKPPTVPLLTANKLKSTQTPYFSKTGFRADENSHVRDLSHLYRNVVFASSKDRCFIIQLTLGDCLLERKNMLKSCGFYNVCTFYTRSKYDGLCRCWRFWRTNLKYFRSVLILHKKSKSAANYICTLTKLQWRQVFHKFAAYSKHTRVVFDMYSEIPQYETHLPDTCSGEAKLSTRQTPSPSYVFKSEMYVFERPHYHDWKNLDPQNFRQEGQCLTSD